MPDPLASLAIAVLAVAGLALLLGRLIPDEYDRLKPEPLPSRQGRSSPSV
jgi:hypothetical protein